MKKVNNKKRSISDKGKLIKKVVSSITLIVITIITFNISVKVKHITDLPFKEQSNINYRIYLKANNYYETPYLEKDMQYISGLIDYIDINFDYYFKISENINYDYKYYIEADLTIFEKNKPNNIIFEKKEKLVEDIVKSETDSSQFYINEIIKINYDEYDNLVRGFKSDYNISADSNLSLTLYIEMNGIYEKLQYPIKKTNEMKVIIPINEQIVNISTEYEKTNDNKSIQISNRGIINNTLLILSIISGAYTIILVIKLIIFIRILRSKKSFYQRNIEKILKNYDRAIAELKYMIHIENEEKVIEIISFEELLDISDRLGKPILFIELEKNKRSWFIVKNGEEIYRYVLEDIDLNYGE